MPKKHAKVAVVAGPRPATMAGLAMVEERLLTGLRAKPSGFAISGRIVGGRSARRYAQLTHATWYPGVPHRRRPLLYDRCDLVHLLGLDVRPPKRKPYVVNVYDLASFRYDDESPPPAWSHALLAGASLVLTTSEMSAKDLEHFFRIEATRIRVIPLGPKAGVETAKPLTPSELAGLGITAPFVLRLGGYTQRKNVKPLLTCWPEIHKRTGATLVLAGPAHPTRDALLASALDAPGIVSLDFVSDATVARLLRSAEVLVSTSTYEGFGLPPLEAMVAGTPVVAVAAEAVAEVCGSAAVLTGPSPEAIAEGLLKVLEDSALRVDLTDRGRTRSQDFTWDLSCDAVLAAYREVLV